MNLEKLDRVLVAVKDLEASARYFSDLLGLTFDEVHEDPSQNVKYIRTPLGFELIQSTTPDGAVARFIEKRGEGLYGVIFKTSDMQSSIKELEAKGLTCVGNPVTGGLEEAYFHPKDSKGVMIVLCEYDEMHGATMAEIKGK
jgi:methylmalonyl-CoA epimerase